MKMKLIRYGYLIRYAFDLGRIFPIIIKQRGVSNFIAGTSSHILNAPTNIWVFLLNLDLQFKTGYLTTLSGWISEMWLYILSLFRPDTAIPFLLGQL